MPRSTIAENSSGMRKLTGSDCVRGITAVWIVLGLEGIVTFALARREVTSSWELTHGLVNLVPLVLPVAAILGVIASWVLTNWASSDVNRRSRGWLVFAASLGCGLAAWSIGGGRHLASLGMRLGFATVVAFATAGLAWWGAPRLARLARLHPGLMLVAGWLVILLLELVNRFVLVRLYPGFHVSLAIATLLLAPLMFWAWTDPDRTSRAGKTRKTSKPAWALVALVGLCAVATPLMASSARGLAHFDNFRLILTDRAPLLGQGVKWAARIAPPPPLLDCGAQGWDATCGQQPPSGEPSAVPAPSFSLRGRDILLITVDALRADHLGTYGYSRPTSPNIDRLAQKAVKFNYAYAPTAHTSYSVTSMMTGKYMRPLLLQGAGADSDTFATLLQRYGYRTAAFYPPAVFFIDPQRFVPFRDKFLGFEYRKVEFLEGPERVEQVNRYVEAEPIGQRLFVWVHLFGPHEPYEARPGHDFGSRDVDRYDSEIAYADAAIGEVTKAFLARRPGALVILSADHGEEFGDHGGRYHGSTVYDEQVRVPLIIHAPDLFTPRAVNEPVQTVDLLPTVLAALEVPQPPRVRGRNLASLVLGNAKSDGGLALAESEDQVMLAQGSFRLICQRQIGACRLFDVATDPGEQTDLRSTQTERFEHMRRREQELSASHGQYETQGLRAEGKGWPSAILRGVAGDGDSAEEVAALLDDADSAIRRKAAELLFDLNRPNAATALRLALTRDEDPVVRAWCALALTRAGQGAPLVYDLLSGHDVRFARLAALALADAGDSRGVEQLVGWWRDEPSRSYLQSRWLLTAFGRLRAKSAVPALVRSLGDVRLRPHIAAALAEIGDSSAREPLARAFADERYQNARVAVAKALVQLHAREEMARPLLRFLGVPDPIPGGLGLAQAAKVLQYVGGPEPKELMRLTKNANFGTRFLLVIPKIFSSHTKELRLIVKVSNQGSGAGEVRVLPVRGGATISSNSQTLALRNFNSNQLAPLIIPVPEKAEAVELHRPVPQDFHWSQGSSINIDLLATSGVQVEALAVVPLADELPPPPPRPWMPDHEPAQSMD